MKTVAVIHTGPVTLEPLKQLFNELLPDVRVINLMDDSLLNDVMRAGFLTNEVKQRLYMYMTTAEQMNADIILNACSSVSEAVDAVKDFIQIPILKIDEAMAEKAIEIGTNIGVLATVGTTLEPTVRLIEKKAKEKGKEVVIKKHVVDEAFQAVLNGDGERHDKLLIEALQQLTSQVDVVVLAQVSMARLVESIENQKTPILSSPRLGIERVKEIIKA